MMTDGMPGRPIASGRTADIYPWGEGEIVKLFHAWVSPGDVEAERRKASVAHAMGLPTPAVGGIVHEAGRLGLVFEQVAGPSMLDELTVHPQSGQGSARLLATLHKQLHERRPASEPQKPDHRQNPEHRENLDQRRDPERRLPTQGHVLKAKISTRLELSNAERSALLDALERLRTDDTLCHGDFHPGNVMMTARGPVIIDWVDATYGNPVADVARTSLLFMESMDAGGVPGVPAEAIEQYHQTYLDEYFKGEPERRRIECDQWLPIVAAARMAEGIEGRQEWLVQQVRHGLNRRRT